MVKIRLAIIRSNETAHLFLCRQNRRLALHLSAQWGAVQLKAKSLFILKEATVLGIHASGVWSRCIHWMLLFPGRYGGRLVPHGDRGSRRGRKTCKRSRLIMMEINRRLKCKSFLFLISCEISCYYFENYIIRGDTNKSMKITLVKLPHNTNHSLNTYTLL